MKKTLFILFSFIALAVSFGSQESNPSPSHDIESIHAARKDSLLKCLSLLETHCTERIDPKQVELWRIYAQCRQFLKQWEYLQDYLDPWYFKDEINGAPLPKLERETYGILVMQPKGMQVIDDLLFSEAPNVDELISLIRKLKQSIEKAPAPRLNDGMIWMAARTALNRVYTLSLSGFDTPGSTDGLKDAIHVLEAIRADLNHYGNILESVAHGKSDTLQGSFKKAIDYLLQNPRFETFDRFTFYQSYLAPLAEQMLQAHKTSGIEFPSEVDYKTRPVNENAALLFDRDFLVKNYFLKMPPAYHNQDVRELGRMLFYDPILSKDVDRSCAGCHNPEMGFTDGLAKSIATGRQVALKRNSPTILNCVYSERFFHDMRARTLEDQLEHVVSGKQEFATDWHEILNRLNASTQYKNLFDRAFKSNDNKPVTIHQVQYALTAFVGNIAEIESHFDSLIRGEIEPKKSDMPIIRGYNLFMGKAACGTCHFAPVFTGLVPPYFNDSESEVLGVPENPKVRKPKIDPDEGRAHGMLKENVYFNHFAFKTPTIRNIDLTGPYMHNGSYQTLLEVMDFYNKGGGAGIGIHLEHQTLASDPLKLNKKEIADIISFMKSLNNVIRDEWKKPKALPEFEHAAEWNKRVIGGIY